MPRPKTPTTPHDEIPCQQDPNIAGQIKEFTEILQTQAHSLLPGVPEKDFYESGIFEGAIQSIRGKISASMTEKKVFVQHVLNHMQDRGFILDWFEAGGANRHDYTVTLTNGKTAAIELKGCLDGNNTNISVRPPHAHEFIVWSVCQNKGADPRHNLWSGVHTRFSADIILESKRLDGLIVWDWLCGTAARQCPKIAFGGDRAIEIGPFRLPPPCIYLFPGTIPSPRNNPTPKPQSIDEVGILKAMKECFGCRDEELNYVSFDTDMKGVEIVRTTRIVRGGVVRRESKPTPLRRS